MSDPRFRLLFARDLRDAGCGRHVTRELLHLLGVRVGRRKLAIPAEAWEQYLRVRAMRPAVIAALFGAPSEPITSGVTASFVAAIGSGGSKGGGAEES